MLYIKYIKYIKCIKYMQAGEIPKEWGFIEQLLPNKSVLNEAK